MLFLDSIIYLIIYFYLDQVLPNEYGINKNPFFFITCLFKKKRKNSENNLQIKNNKIDIEEQPIFKEMIELDV